MTDADALTRAESVLDGAFNRLWGEELLPVVRAALAVEEAFGPQPPSVETILHRLGREFGSSSVGRSEGCW